MEPSAGVDGASLAELESAPPATRAAVLGRLQGGAGNASVCRMIARAAAQEAVDELMETSRERGTDIPPHPPGDRSEDLLELGSKPGGLAAAFGGAGEAAGGAGELPGSIFGGEVSAAPETAAEKTEAPAPAKAGASEKDAPAAAPASAVDPEIVRWLARQPNTDPDMAAWLLAGEEHGFVRFRPFYRKQMADIRDRKTHLTVVVDVDRSVPKKPKTKTGPMKSPAGAAAEPLGVLTILTGLTRARAQRWVDNPTKEKPYVDAGDLIRDLPGRDAHTSGASADLFPKFSWTGPGGPAQVMQVLEDLPTGSYVIGLPMQGQFFPKEEYLDTRQKKSIAEAGPGGTPKDVVQPSLVYWTGSFYTSKYDPSKGSKYPWVDSEGSGGVVNRLRSGALKDKIEALRSQGIAIDVIPDYDGHIHITRT